MSLTYNNLKSTTVRGTFKNIDDISGSLLASAQFDRDVSINGNLALGKETITYDSSNNPISYTITGGNIVFTTNGISYSISTSLLRSTLLNNSFSSTTQFTYTNATNSVSLIIKPGFNNTTLANGYITYDSSPIGSSHFFNGNLMCNTFSSVNGCTLGNGNDMSRVRRNLNIDNVLRIAYNDAIDVGASLSNNAVLDISGNIYVKGTINSIAGLYATQSYVNAQVASIVNSSPVTLDTLSELANALGNDPNFATTMTTLIGTKTTLSAVQSNNNTWSGFNSFNTYLPTSTLTPLTSSDLVTKGYCDTQITNTQTTIENNVSTNYALKTYVDTSLNNYALKSYVDSADNALKSYIDTSLNNYVLKSNVDNSLNAYATKTYVDTSLNNYALKSYVDTSLNNYALKSYVDTSLTNYALKSYVDTSLNNYALKSYVDTSLNNYALKTYVDSQVATKTDLATVQSNNNTFSGITTFTGNISANATTISPTNLSYISTLSSNAQTQLNNRVTLTSAQTISGTKTITGNIIANAYTITPVTLSYIANLSSDAQTQLSAKTTLLGVQGNNNVWTGTNAFNTSLPTSTLTPSLSTELVTKDYCDTQVNTKTDLTTVQSNNNTFAGLNTFSNATTGLIVNNNAKFGEVGGTTFLKNDLRIFDVTTKAETGFTQLYQSGQQLSFINHKANGVLSFQIKNSADISNIEFLRISPSSFNVKNVNALIDQNLTVSGAINGISSTTLSYLDATSSIQTQINTVNTKLSGITYTSGTDTTTIDNNVIINGTIKNQYGVLIGATKYLSGTYTNLAFPCEEYILCNLTTFTYASPYTLVLPSITLNNGSITVRILTNSTFVQVYPPGSTTALYDANRVNQSSIMMTPDTFISLTFMATSSGWVVTNYATNNNLIITNSVSTNNLYMYGPTTISSFVNPTSSSQVGYSMSGNNFANFTATLSGSLTPLCTISIPSFGVWMLTLKTRIQSLTNDNYCGYHVAFHAQTNATSLSETAYIYSTQQVPIATGKLIEFSFTTIQAFYSGITFGTQTFTTAPFTIYSGYSAWWATANTGVISQNYKITRIA